MKDNPSCDKGTWAFLIIGSILLGGVAVALLCGFCFCGEDRILFAMMAPLVLPTMITHWVITARAIWYRSVE